MDLILAQFLTGLAAACSLFLVASGLSLIFGVTRIVNFAHGAFYMLGAYMAYWLQQRLAGALGFWGALVLAALVVGALGALMEMTLLRRIYRAPELFQLLATFGVALMMEDLVVILFGPEDLLGARAPGLKGAVDVLGQAVPSYDLFLMALGPLVLLALTLALKATRWGILVRAATQDREMVAALGVNQKWLFTSVFALGVFLAALGGALQLPRGETAHHTMDLKIIVEAFVVVVIGGLGSVPGAFLAALLVAELNAFGILVLPQVSLVLVFLVMAVVLVARPYGLLGRPQSEQRGAPGFEARPWRPFTAPERAIALGLAALAAMLPLVGGAYALSVAAEVALFALFAASLQLVMGAGGMASFGHAAYFGLGAYGAALAVKAGLPMPGGLIAGPALAFLGAVAFGWFCVRLSGVYSAMLTLAFAQIAWAVAFQWVSVTGGDNGLLGIWPAAWAAGPAAFYWLALAAALAGVAALRVVIFAPFGLALRAVRDNPARAEALGLSRQRVQWAAFALAGTFAGVAGALFAFLKGSVFPDVLGIPLSVDALAMVLLGGVGTVIGPVPGAIVYKLLSIVLVSASDYSKLMLGALVVALVVAAPRGIAGAALALLARRRAQS
ncbi:ABC transporter permease [Xanthobacter sp. KR7-225]|uniref:ABC transporter permease n=1 Tax=Xanthobacter sp. KR7-225 TaxID=3156613 RepID=UPI0032B41BD7